MHTHTYAYAYPGMHMDIHMCAYAYAYVPVQGGLRARLILYCYNCIATITIVPVLQLQEVTVPEGNYKLYRIGAMYLLSYNCTCYPLVETTIVSSVPSTGYRYMNPSTSTIVR